MVSELAGYACDQVKLVANAERMLPSRLPASDLQLDALALHTGIIERGSTRTRRERSRVVWPLIGPVSVEAVAGWRSVRSAERLQPIGIRVCQCCDETMVAYWRPCKLGTTAMSSDCPGIEFRLAGHNELDGLHRSRNTNSRYIKCLHPAC
ncbi:hypothetical protein LB505_010394 [Fusarium chuoi]|nr:hypothetical protein LB505_010394 [Fusarium chuoi]